MKTYLPLLLLLLFFAVQSAAFELTGKAETYPKFGFIKLQGKEILLHGVQIISQNANCKDSRGQWACGKAAWKALKNKLGNNSINCKLIPNKQNLDKNPKQANCLLNEENLSIWLVSRGWALTNKEPNEFLLSQEYLASQKNAGIWRDGFIPPDLWRTSFKKDSKNCNVCSIRRQSFLRKTSKKKLP